jgi:hypothetical protein
VVAGPLNAPIEMRIARVPRGTRSSDWHTVDPLLVVANVLLGSIPFVPSATRGELDSRSAMATTIAASPAQSAIWTLLSVTVRIGRATIEDAPRERQWTVRAHVCALVHSAGQPVKSPRTC